MDEDMLSKYSLERDLLSVFLAGLVFVASVNYFSIAPPVSSEVVGLIISILATILGVLLTILAIMYTFEKNIKSRVMAALDSRDAYPTVYDRFIDSIKGIFYSIVLLILVYLFLGLKLVNNHILQLELLIVVITTAFSLLRTYRCFYLFTLLQTALNNEKIAK